MVAQDPTHTSQADDLTSISEIPGDLAGKSGVDPNFHPIS
jgi:hypothetical protein